MLERLRNQAILWIAALLFLAGLKFFGVPPMRMSSGSTASAQAETTASRANDSADKIVVSSSNGAPEDDKDRQAEQNLARTLFERAYSDATLYFSTWQFSPDSFFAKFIGGTLPDVLGVFATEATVVVDRKMAADITDEVKGWKLYPLIHRNMIDPITREGRIYGMPNGGVGGFYVMALFYNTRMFREAGLVDAGGAIIPPDTWDDFTTYALKLTDRKRGIAGFGILGDTAACGWHFLNWGWQAGGEFERRRPDGTWESVFHLPECVRALQFIKDLRWKHDVLQRNVLATNDELFQLFAADRVAMAIFTPEYLTYLVDKYDMPFDKIGICLLPRGPGGRANQIGGSFSLLNPRLSGVHKQRAFDSMTFGYELDVIEPVVKLLAQQKRRVGIPVIPIFAPEYQDKIDAIVNRYRNVPDLTPLMRQAAEAVRLEPPYRCQALYDLYLGPAVQEVLVDKDADPAKLLRTASDKFQLRELDPINKQLRQPAQ